MPRVRPGVAAFVGLAALAVVANVVAQVLMHAQDHDVDFGSLVLDASVGCVYAIAALVVRRWARLPAAVLLIGAFVWTAGTLSIGLQRSPVWVPLYAVQGGLDVVVVWLALTYPDGRLQRRLPQVAVGAAFALWAFLLLVRLLVENAGAWKECDCAANPIALLGSRALDDALQPVAPFGNAVVAILAVTAALVRWRRAGTTWRAINLLMTVAVVVLGAVWLLFDVQYVWDLGFDGPGPYWLRAATMASVAVLFTVSLSSMRATRARVADLLLATRDDVDPAGWEQLVRNALGDPSARIALWNAADHRYRYPEGEDAGTPVQEIGVLLVASDGLPLALVRHDPVLAANPDLLASVAEAIRLAIENRRLARELADSLHRVRESRARIVDAADEARRRIERDLHDGAQQLLMSTSLILARTTARAGRTHDAELVDDLERATAQLTTARAELRRLAQGITPMVLQHGGIVGALGELALRSPTAVSIRVDGDRTLPEVVASTAYFVVSECLTNVGKHAEATSVSVVLELSHPASVTIVDDGRGGADLDGGTGLRGLTDRVEALGGRLTVGSRPAGGTTVVAVLEAAVPASGTPARA